MRTRILRICLLSACLLLLKAQAVAQTPVNFDLSAYERVSTGLFANFSFPAHPIFSAYDGFERLKWVRVRDGIFLPQFNESGYIDRIGIHLKSVEYADVVGDRRPEAVVTLGTICDCTGVSHGVFIYRVGGARPRLLWSFGTGDRADGGLHRVYARAGDLVVETYGAGSGPDRPPKEVPDGRCCGREYTRRRYRWVGNRFVQTAKPEVVSLQ